MKGGDKNARSLSNTANLMDHYKPEVIAIEDTKGSRRGSRVQALAGEIAALARSENIRVNRFSRKQVNLGILQDARRNKYAVAEQLAARFPDELGFRLPGKRHLWDAERYQMDIFDAVALAQHCIKSSE